MQSHTIHNNLLDEVIMKARRKGADITSWNFSPNKRVVINSSGKLPVYYLSVDAAADSLIHQYKLACEYRYLYDNAGKKLDVLSAESVSSGSQKSFLMTQILYECDAIIQNMDHEMVGSTKRKLSDLMENTIISQNLNLTDFYDLQNALLAHYRKKMKETSVSQKKKQFQQFVRFLEEINHPDA